MKILRQFWSMHIEQRRTNFRRAFAACLIAVTILALMPPATDMPTTGWDKANHALAFAVMAMLGFASYPQRKMAVLLGLLAYGGLIELLQGLTPYRTSEWPDLLADGIGLVLGTALMHLLERLRALRSRL